MADDQTFRLILILGLAAVLPVGAYHRVRSRRHASGSTGGRKGSSFC